jgi:hypothetical protein
MLPFVNAIATLLHYVPFIQSLHHILLDMRKYLMMQSSIRQMVRARTSDDPIVDIPEGSIRRGRGQCSNAPPPPPCPPVSLVQLLAIQNGLMWRLVENNEHHGAERQQPQHQERDLSYSNFLVTQPPVFDDAIDPLEVAPHHVVHVWTTPLH